MGKGIRRTQLEIADAIDTSEVTVQHAYKYILKNFKDLKKYYVPPKKKKWETILEKKREKKWSSWRSRREWIIIQKGVGIDDYRWGYVDFPSNRFPSSACRCGSFKNLPIFIQPFLSEETSKPNQLETKI